MRPPALACQPELAADVVWFDALLTNVDRTPRNPNLLLWHRRLWLIDHGAAIYTQHSWNDDLEAIAANAGARFPIIRDHVLLPIAGSIQEADARLAPLLSPDLMREAVAAVPDELLEDLPPFATPERHRQAYVTHLTSRLAATTRLGRRGGGGAPCPSLRTPSCVERAPFAYATIRVVPRVEREEFVNAGVVLFSRPRKFLGVRRRGSMPNDSARSGRSSISMPWRASSTYPDRSRRAIPPAAPSLAYPPPSGSAG